MEANHIELDASSGSPAVRKYEQCHQLMRNLELHVVEMSLW